MLGWRSDIDRSPMARSLPTLEVLVDSGDRKYILVPSRINDYFDTIARRRHNDHVGIDSALDCGSEVGELDRSTQAHCHDMAAFQPCMVNRQSDSRAAAYHH
jgi:hypothetical protein